VAYPFVIWLVPYTITLYEVNSASNSPPNQEYYQPGSESY